MSGANGARFKTRGYILGLPVYPSPLNTRLFVYGKVQTRDVCLIHTSHTVLLPLKIVGRQKIRSIINVSFLQTKQEDIFVGHT